MKYLRVWGAIAATAGCSRVAAPISADAVAADAAVSGDAVADAGSPAADARGDDDASTQPREDAGLVPSVPRPPRVEALCSAAEVGIEIPTGPDIGSRLVGVWWPCTTTPLFTPLGASPIEFAADGHWYRMVPGASPDVLARASGFGNEGTYSAVHGGLALWYVLRDGVPRGAFPRLTFVRSPVKLYARADDAGAAAPYVRVSP